MSCRWCKRRSFTPTASWTRHVMSEYAQHLHLSALGVSSTASQGHCSLVSPRSVFSHYLIEIGPQVTLDHESLQIPKVRGQLSHNPVHWACQANLHHHTVISLPSQLCHPLPSPLCHTHTSLPLHSTPTPETREGGDIGKITLPTSLLPPPLVAHSSHPPPPLSPSPNPCIPPRPPCPQMYHADAPWTVAQEKLRMMNIVRVS